MKKGFIICLSLALTFLMMPKIHAANIENGVPYTTYAEDYRRRLIPTQDAYIPITTYSRFGNVQLNSPEDLFLAQDDTMYIADTGNRRIVIITKNLASITTIGEGHLVRPTGVYVDADHQIFVADFEQNKIVKFDSSGNVLAEFKRPTEPMFGSSTLFRPNKIAGDTGGNLYIISEGTYQGMIQLNLHGEFLGFFGANPTRPDLRTIVMKQIFSEEILENFFRVTPQTTTNLAIDANNRIHSVTRGAKGNAVKRLNVSGVNRLPGNLNDTVNMNAVAVGPIGNIYTTADDGFIREYDAEGNLLFQFGGKDTRAYQKGLFNMPSGIAVDASFNLYVLDRAKSELQVFVPTDFARLVHQAVSLYQEGHYLESKEPWEAVLASNAMFDLAHRGIGAAYYKEGMYAEALHAYELGGDRVGYSDAYWELRNEWLMSNLSMLLIVGIAAYALLKINRFVLHKQGIDNPLHKVKDKAMANTLTRELAYVNHMRKHPLDALYGIKREKKASVLSASILYGVFFLQRLFAIFYLGDAFNTHELATFSLVDEFIGFMGPLLLFVIANYLVCAVNDGEGKLKDVYIGTIYALTPMLMFWPIIIILSRFLTLNEAFIVDAGLFILQAWSAGLLFFMIKDIHNYSIFETIKIIAITAFTIVIFVVSIILLTGLSRQIIDFIREIIAEVIVRG